MALERWRRLGIARVIPRKRYTAEAVVKALREVLYRHSYLERARSVERQIRAENGAAHACDLLERLCLSATGSAARPLL